MGSFHIGGHAIRVTGEPAGEILPTPGGVSVTMDDDGTYQVGQMYVRYFLPERCRGAPPSLLIHGGGLTGVC